MRWRPVSRASVAAAVLAAGIMAAAATAVDGPAGGGEEVLQKQVADLVEALAAARSEIDSLRAALDEARMGAGQGVSLSPVRKQAVPAAELRMVDVNEDLRMVVLDAGTAAGMKPGMRFGVTRAGRAVAEIQVIDVRKKISGAAVVKANRGTFPSVEDGLVDILARPE